MVRREAPDRAPDDLRRRIRDGVRLYLDGLNEAELASTVVDCAHHRRFALPRGRDLAPAGGFA